MGVVVAVTTVIERPIAEVAAYAGDPSNAPGWQGTVEAATWETDPPMRLGSRIRFRAKVVGREFDATYEIVELTPNEQVAMRTADGPFPMRTTFTWRPVGDRVTHMVFRIEGEPTGLARLAAPMIAAALRRTMTDDVEVLKRRLEAGT